MFGLVCWYSTLLEQTNTKYNEWWSSWSCGGQGKNCLSKICEESFTLSDVTGK